MGFDPSDKADRENDFTEVWKEYTPISVKKLINYAHIHVYIGL